MIKFENTDIMGFENAIRGMRNPKNSWSKSDSDWEPDFDTISGPVPGVYVIGPNDYKLMKTLRNAGTDHRKFMRMITVYVDITAPLYWWKEFDTYKVGTVANSCSTMHKIADKEFTLDDFSWEQLLNTGCDVFEYESEKGLFSHSVQPLGLLKDIIIPALNICRERYLKTKDEADWWQIIQLLPSSYNQKRTVMMNYEVLANIYKSRKNHKLDEWSVGFINWIKELPYSEFITGEFKDEVKEEK